MTCPRCGADRLPYAMNPEPDWPIVARIAFKLGADERGFISAAMQCSGGRVNPAVLRDAWAKCPDPGTDTTDNGLHGPATA